MANVDEFLAANRTHLLPTDRARHHHPYYLRDVVRPSLRELRERREQRRASSLDIARGPRSSSHVIHEHSFS
jgi:hypothetical protein